VTGPWNAAALPEIMAGAVEESKRCAPVPFHEGKAAGQPLRGVPVRFQEGQAAGQKPGSVAGVRGSGTAEARARPNVEVNRRAEGTSELNRRLGDGVKGAVALERCGAAGDYGWGVAGRQARRKASSMCLCLSTKVKQKASNREALPERAEVERQKPERGLTFAITGVQKQSEATLLNVRVDGIVGRYHLSLVTSDSTLPRSHVSLPHDSASVLLRGSCARIRYKN